MSTISVSVTQVHIESGKQGSVCQCPIALALHDAGYAHVAVRARRAFLYQDDNHRLNQDVTLPTEAVQFIRRFDLEQPVAPFTFMLEVKA